MDAVTIQTRKDGPYVVTGPVKLIDSTGKEFTIKPPIALCRCGQSSNKPFCDGTHKRAGFVSDPQAR
ncbi:MAG: CDGSH iron-sulfur domain-containing protein [Chloroflexota bacterium]|nr:CDGSH iron-sulfur domain-containing protein [Chloroflexota bacterium]